MLHTLAQYVGCSFGVVGFIALMGMATLPLWYEK